jgi:hypothetical protein
MLTSLTSRRPISLRRARALTTANKKKTRLTKRGRIMKIFWVLAYDQYYPYFDNFDQSFETYEEAEAYVESEKAKDYPRDHYDIINISGRL